MAKGYVFGHLKALNLEALKIQCAAKIPPMIEPARTENTTAPFIIVEGV